MGKLDLAISGFGTATTAVAYKLITDAQRTIALTTTDYSRGIPHLDYFASFLEQDLEAPEVVLYYVDTMRDLLLSSYGRLDLARMAIVVGGGVLAYHTLKELIIMIAMKRAKRS